MRKILIATTSEETVTGLSKALSQYEIHTCSTGTEALEMLETLQPDIFILDLMLPMMDGLTVLRESGFKPSVILARTNFLSATIAQAAENAGVEDLLLIPCTVSYIVNRLNALTEKVPSPVT